MYVKENERQKELEMINNEIRKKESKKILKDIINNYKLQKKKRKKVRKY